MTGHSTSPWAAFAAGAVAILAIALLIFAWMGRDEATEVAKTAAAAARVIPDLEPPRIPEAPRIPDNPMPRPK
ncbi:hypothetical protein [Phenylobacterium sp.]|uniref:hypothetical protein n=1 Tax=Phenylobacterium sp. TaxID=1871053 RepID=UPI002ED89D87